MTSKHSEGPWEYDPEHLVVRGLDDREICDIGFHVHPDRSPGEEMQRAHLLGLLIAQAPDLKKENEALRGAVAYFTESLRLAVSEASKVSDGRGCSEWGGCVQLQAQFEDTFDPILKTQGKLP
ncbi:MAG: hypothetical protein GY930_15415 [bacterium]|nr:hypothetical protein [bacterium]